MLPSNIGHRRESPPNRIRPRDRKNSSPRQSRLRAGAARLDLHAVTALDSAGLALLAELAADGPLDVHGTPPGLTELCGAYRLTPTLGYVSA